MSAPQYITNGDRTKSDKIKEILVSRFGTDRFGGEARQGRKLDEEDKINMTIGVLLKWDNKKLLEFVNSEREKRGLEADKIDKRVFYDFKKAYADILDQCYVEVATYIGDAYPFADKLHRIGLYNDIIDATKSVVNSLGFAFDDMTYKKANLLLKAMERMNNEMGNKSLTDFLIPKDKRHLSEENEIDEFTKDDIDKFFVEKYKNLLPDPVTQKVVFSDYTNCAFSEKLGSDGKYICWHDGMASKTDGRQCAVQAGIINTCPKFLNKTLLESKEFLIRIKQTASLNWREVAKMLGADSVDEEIRDRIAFYYRKHEISSRVDFGAGNPKFSQKENTSETDKQEDI